MQIFTIKIRSLNNCLKGYNMFARMATIKPKDMEDREILVRFFYDIRFIAMKIVRILVF